MQGTGTHIVPTVQFKFFRTRLIFKRPSVSENNLPCRTPRVSTGTPSLKNFPTSHSFTRLYFHCRHHHRPSTGKDGQKRGGDKFIASTATITTTNKSATGRFRAGVNGSSRFRLGLLDTSSDSTPSYSTFPAASLLTMSVHLIYRLPRELPSQLAKVVLLQCQERLQIMARQIVERQLAVAESLKWLSQPDDRPAAESDDSRAMEVCSDSSAVAQDCVLCHEQKPCQPLDCSTCRDHAPLCYDCTAHLHHSSMRCPYCRTILPVGCYHAMTNRG
jgi:hypothetical protein